MTEVYWLGGYIKYGMMNEEGLKFFKRLTDLYNSQSPCKIKNLLHQFDKRIEKEKPKPTLSKNVRTQYQSDVANILAARMKNILVITDSKNGSGYRYNETSKLWYPFSNQMVIGEIPNEIDKWISEQPDNFDIDSKSALLKGRFRLS